MTRTNRRGLQGRARRSKTLGANDPRGHRDPQNTLRGDLYREPLYVDKDGRLALRVDGSTDPAIEVGPEGLRFDETPQYVLPDTISATTINGTTTLQRQGLEVGHLYLPMYDAVFASATPSWSATGNAEFPIGANADRYRFPVDLQRYDEYRFRCMVIVASTTASSSLQLQYATTQTGTLLDLDSGATTISLDSGSATTGVEVDTDWQDLVSGAQIEEAWLGITQVNVTGASRHVARVVAEFRAKSA